MPEKKKVSRREFLAKTSLVASAASVGGLPGGAMAAETKEYVQSEFGLRAKALVSVLTKKNLINPATIDQVIDYYETKVGPHNGARLVARCWVDPEYRGRVLSDAGSAARELDITGVEGTDLVAVANTPEIHNLVVCTLCSCYPWPLLGLPPTWYKDTAYRARAVIDPRGVLKEFGLELDEDIEVRVWDSTAEVRYIVIPDRPPGTDGMTEKELRGLVTRNSMVGVEKAKSPVRGGGR
jgi:nitrile hydratase